MIRAVRPGYRARMDATEGGPLRAEDLLARVAHDFASQPDAALDAFVDGVRTLERDTGLDAQRRVRLWARAGQLAVFAGRIDHALRFMYDASTLAEDGYLALQLGNALTWYGDEPSIEEAEGHFARALTHARRARDGPLAIGALCGRGEAELWRERPEAARASFGEALGITEFSSGDAPTITPLAGLASAHAATGLPGKAGRLAERALERALRVGDVAGEARARLVAARIGGDRDGLLRAAETAERAPHRPLALRAKVEAWRRDPDETVRTRLLAEARAAGLRGDAAVLGGAPGRGGGSGAP